MAVAIPILILAEIAGADVAFPIERKAFAAGEEYPLDKFGRWQVSCLRDAEGEDFCYPTTIIADYEAGLEIVFSVLPYGPPSGKIQVDVEIAPRAEISVQANSDAEHYTRYSVAILSVSGTEFDGYWCRLTNDTNCLRGPELGAKELGILLNGVATSLIVFRSDDDPESVETVTSIDVDLVDLKAAFDRANRFNAAIRGYRPEDFIDIEMCTFRQDGRERRLSYTYDEEFENENVSIRESTFGPAAGGTCPGYVTLAYLTPEATNAERQLFCLVTNEDQELVGFQVGERDAYVQCDAPSKSFCERVNDSTKAAVAISGFGAGVVGGTVGTTVATGTTVVAHSSGALILTGTSGYVAGTLGTIGTTALGILTAPVTVTAAAVTVVAVGGAVYVCSDPGKM